MKLHELQPAAGSRARNRVGRYLINGTSGRGRVMHV